MKQLSLKKMIIFITLLFTFIGEKSYTNTFNFKTVLDSAFTAYNKKDYKKAIQFYHQIIDSGFASAYLYYNIGNAYFRTNEIAKAILYYEKAKLLNPKDPDIEHNLKYANALISDKINELPEPFYITWFRQITYLFNANTWAWISISLFLLILVLIYVNFLSSSLFFTRLIKTIATFIFFAWIFSLSTTYYTYKYSASKKYAIIMSKVVEVKSSPDENSTSLFVLHEGTKVYIKDEFEEWLEIKIADGNTGWLKTTDVEKI